MSLLKPTIQALSCSKFLLLAVLLLIIAGIDLFFVFTSQTKPETGSGLSYLGVLRDIQGSTLILKAEPKQNPSLKQRTTLQIKTSPQTVFLQRKRPASIPEGADPSHLFKQEPITLKDLQTGDILLITGLSQTLLSQEPLLKAKTVIVFKTIK